jgi:hypothetical protein
MEIVASKKPQTSHTILQDSLARLPASVFTSNNVANLTKAAPSILVPLAVSFMTSDMTITSGFYVKEMMANRSYSSVDPSRHVLLSTYRLHGANILLRFVQRSPASTHGDFKVSDLEKVKVAAHEMAHADMFCGVSKWYDNHFAYDQSAGTLDAFKDRFDANGRKYHIFGDCKSSSKPGPGTNLNVFDPFGNSIQLDGTWTHCPVGGSGDSLQNPCSQGKCSSYRPSTSCARAVTARCGDMRSSIPACTDCAYTHWHELSQQGCANANVVVFCNSSTWSETFFA